MSNFQFDADREAYVYVMPQAEHGYGHLRAYFRIPVPNSGLWPRSIEFTLSSQCGARVTERQIGDFAESLYGIQFLVQEVLPKDLRHAATLYGRLEKVLAQNEVRVGENGLDVWSDMLLAACDAWKIKHGHLFQSVRDHRSIPDTPYFGDLQKVTGFVKFQSAIEAVFNREMVSPNVTGAPTAA